MTSLQDIEAQLKKAQKELQDTRNALDLLTRRLGIVEGMQVTNNVSKDNGSDVSAQADEVYRCLDIPVYWGDDGTGAVKFGTIKLQWDGTRWVGSGSGILVTDVSKANAAPITDPSGVLLTLVKDNESPAYCYLSNVILGSDVGAMFNSEAKWYSVSDGSSGVLQLYFDGNGKAYARAVWA